MEMNRLPRYLLVVPWDLSHVGGVNEVVRNLYREFQEQDIAVPSVLIPRWECKRLSRQHLDGRTTFNLRMPAPPLPGSDLAKKCASFLAGAPTALLQLYQLLKNDRIHVVNAHYPGPYLFHFTLLKKLFPDLFRFVISCHGSDVLAMENGAPGTAVSRLVLRWGDAVTVPSRALAMKLATAVPEISEKITCIYNGIGRDKYLCRDGLNAGSGMQGRYITHVGSFEKVKGQDVLLHAFKRVREVHRDIRLLLVGRSGSLLPDIESMSAAMGIADAVTVMTDLAPERIPPLLQQAQLVVLPSRYEGGIPLVLLEAGAVRKAVVATDAGGIGELIRSGQNGLLVPPENPQALALAILTLLNDSGLMEKMANNLHDAVSGSFSWKTTASRYLELALQ